MKNYLEKKCEKFINQSSIKYKKVSDESKQLKINSTGWQKPTTCFTRTGQKTASRYAWSLKDKKMKLSAQKAQAFLNLYKNLLEFILFKRIGEEIETTNDYLTARNILSEDFGVIDEFILILIIILFVMV